MANGVHAVKLLMESGDNMDEFSLQLLKDALQIVQRVMDHESDWPTALDHARDHLEEAIQEAEKT